MKIAVIASLYRPYTRGGAEVVAQTIIDELKKHHDVAVITLSPWKGLRSLFPTCAEEDDVRVYRFYPENIFSFIHIDTKSFFLRLFWHACDIFNIHSAWVVSKILQKEKPDCVMIHAIKGMGYTVPLAVKRTGIPYTFTVHDVQYVAPSGQYMYGQESHVKNSIVLRVYRAMTRILLGSPQHVIYPSRFLKDFYEEYGFFRKSKKSILPNPIQIPQNGLPVANVQKNDPVRFLYLGQLEPHKGIFFLLDVFEKWRDPDAQLIIAGEGSCEQAVRAACAADARISYAGYMGGGAREELFQKSHFVIVPSLCYENAPLVTGEALSRGIPAVVARIGGAHELIQQMENGFIFTPQDIEDCIRTLSGVKDVACMRYPELSRVARESVQECTVEKYCKEILARV